LMIGIDKEGWPLRLDFLKPLSRGCKSELKFLFTILMLSRTLRPIGKERNKLSPSFSTITDLSKPTRIIPSGFINKFVRDFNLFSGKPAFDRDKDIFLSLKAGPHGKATRSAMHSLGCLTKIDIERLCNLTDEAGAEYLEKQYQIALDLNLKPQTKLRGILSETQGKLSLVYDPECKVRVIAIIDYMTQLFLKPINDKLFSIVRKLPQDRTFTQDPTNCWESNSEKFWSLDLSAATDRFPVQLQRRLLERIFSDSKMAQSWFDIFQNKDFAVPSGSTYEYSIRYSVGQPMGSYSSWIAFTLSHHLLVHWCAHLCGVSQFNQYIILGDDIVIKHDRIAQKYIDWCKYLDVPISLTKTHVSSDTYEFAKRWFKNCDEVTGMPMRGIIDNIFNPFIVYTILYDYFKIKSNLYLYHSSILDLIVTFYSGLRLVSRYKRGRRWIQKFRFIHLNYTTRLRMETFSALLDITFGYSNYQNIRSIFCRYLTNDNFIIPTTTIRSSIEQVIGSGIAQITLNNAYDLQSWLELVKNDSYSSDPLIVSSDPIFISLLSSLKNIRDTIGNFDLQNINMLLTNKVLSGVNVSNIFNNKRNKILEVIEIGRSFEKGMKDLNLFYATNLIGHHRQASREAVKMFPWMLDQIYSKWVDFSGLPVDPKPKITWLGL
jgi:hypothetical protein